MAPASRFNSKIVTRGLWAGYILFLLYWAFRFRGHFPAYVDTLEYAFPEKWFNVDCWQKGRIALWNPDIGCGTPNLANWQSALFYPFFWIWNFTGVSNWYFGMALFHSLLAAAGFYRWLRRLCFERIIAVLCAFAFSGSASATVYWGFPTHQATLAWTPWIFWAALRMRQNPSWQKGAALVLFGSLSLLAGYLFFTLYTFLLLGVWLTVTQKPDGKFKVLTLGVLAAILVITACQWIPFLDFLSYAKRPAWGGHAYSLDWINYKTLLSPEILGAPSTRSYPGETSSSEFNNLYIGLIPLVLWIGSWAGFKRPDGRFWILASIFLFLFLSGVHWFIWRIFPEKLWSLLEPSKACFLFVFTACTSAAFGARQWLVSVRAPTSLAFRAAPWLAFFWLLDLAFIPGRIVHLVPNPFQSPPVQALAAKVQEVVGNSRMISLRDAGMIEALIHDNFEGSIQDTASVLAPDTNIISGIPSVGGHLTVHLDGYQDIYNYFDRGFPYPGRILDAVGTKLFILPQALAPSKYKQLPWKGPSFYELNTRALPTEWVAETSKFFPGRPEVFEEMLNPDVPIEREVLLEKTENGGGLQLAPSLRTLSPILSTDSFKFQTGKTGFLILNESFAPGWRAWVDGRPQPILRADGLLMAVAITGKGIHDAVFRYEPAAFRLGLFVSLLAWVFGGISFIRFPKRNSSHV